MSWDSPKKQYYVIRDLTSEECEWLQDEVIKKGTLVTETDDLFGCCGPDGVFVEYDGMRCPTEVPESALLEAKPGVAFIHSKSVN